LLARLNAAFPDLLFESCASGGNRFDLGMLFYMPQTWTSDDTDALERQGIQWGTSLVFPPSTLGAHVSGAPSHQVLRTTPLETRFHVAAFGLLGYELDLTKLSHFDHEVIAKQIAFYKEHRRTLQYGTFHRVSSPFEGNICLWLVVSGDQSQALVGYYQRLQTANGNTDVLRLAGLEERAEYSLVSRTQYVNVRAFGDLVNTLLPIAIKENGIIHNTLADNYLLALENEALTARGDELMHLGFHPRPQFVGTGFGAGVRLVGDFGSRLYVLSKAEPVKRP